uniref:Uncharacterized protein n=1 Tax=Echinococcus granulosus TaxID=6210 RepID=A0A068WYN9_ECHGR|nr:hypothetical protein EgrG_000540700 [Echinococcus granulosus]
MLMRVSYKKPTYVVFHSLPEPKRRRQAIRDRSKAPPSTQIVAAFTMPHIYTNAFQIVSQ